MLVRDGFHPGDSGGIYAMSRRRIAAPMPLPGKGDVGRRKGEILSKFVADLDKCSKEIK